MTDPEPQGIYVLAGPNGGGKSSVGGQVWNASGGEYFNPDEQVRRLIADDVSLLLKDANSLVWHSMVRLLRQAVEHSHTFAFETTLGGDTVTGILKEAADAGVDVRIWYVALGSAEQHVQRVRARVENGGHPIAEEAIRSRYISSRLNLISLLPALTELRLYDNSAEWDGDGIPEPSLVMRMAAGEILEACALSDVPGWARPIVGAALDHVSLQE